MTPSTPPLSERLVGQLATDIAQQIDPVDAIRQRYNLTEDELRRLLANPVFVQLMREAKAHWESAPSLPERVKVKAGLSLELLIPEVYGVASNPQNGAAVRLDAVRLLAELTGIGKKAGADMGAQAPAERFQLVINVGGKEPVTIEQETVKTIEQVPT